MRDVFGRAGVTFDRIAAVDGWALNEAERAIFLSEHEDYSLEPGEIGCFLSHFAAWKEIVAQEHTYAAVFEDDVRLADSLRSLLTADDWIPKDADIVKLETHDELVVLGPEILPAPSEYTLHALHSRHLGAAGYILSRQGVRKLLQNYARMTGPVDHELFDPKHKVFSLLAAYQLTPAACIQIRLCPEDPNYNRLTSTIVSRFYAKNRYISFYRKIIRETVRPFKQLSARLNRKLQCLTNKLFVTMVPYTGDRGDASHENG